MSPLSHTLCYILHPFAGFISVIFTTNSGWVQNQSACST